MVILGFIYRFVYLLLLEIKWWWWWVKDETLKYISNMILKSKQKEYLEIFMILSDIMRKHDIISFSYDQTYLIVRTGLNDYIRILMKEVKKC